jgi:hypothetical protein
MDPYSIKYEIRYLLAWKQAEEAVYYLSWTLIPNSNSMKIRLKPMLFRTQTPNLMVLQELL